MRAARTNVNVLQLQFQSLSLMHQTKSTQHQKRRCILSYKYKGLGIGYRLFQVDAMSHSLQSDGKLISAAVSRSLRTRAHPRT